MNYTLEAIIKEHLIERGDTQLNRFAQMLQFGVAGLRELHMDVAGAPTIVELEVDGTLDTVTLPPDYIQYVRIGICGADGQIHALGLNNNMCLPRSYDDCGNPTVGHSTTAYGGWYGSLDAPADNFRNGETLGRFFGLGGGLNPWGYYRVDRDRGTINLSGMTGGITHIVLEYIADLKKVDGKFSVHPFAIEAVKAWIYWKSIAYSNTRGLGDRDMARNDYYTARRVAMRRFNTATPDEYIAAFRKGNSATPKF